MLTKKTLEQYKQAVDAVLTELGDDHPAGTGALKRELSQALPHGECPCQACLCRYWLYDALIAVDVTYRFHGESAHKKAA